MNKQTKQPSLFDQALAIAIKEGKAESSKDADPLQSGIVGENYLLFSKGRKLLISFPLEKLKRNTRKKSNTGKRSNCCLRYLGCSVFGIIFFVWFISTLHMGGFFDQKLKIRVKSAAAKSTLAIIAKECAAKIADGGTGTIDAPVPEVQGYRSTKKNIAGFYLGKDRQISGTRIVCLATGEIKLASEDESKNPSFSYNTETGVKSCSHNGPNEVLHGCSARRNGEW